MGSITKAIKDVSGASDDEKEQKERLQVLLVAAKGKLRAFKDEINQNFMNKGLIEKTQVPGIRSIRFIEQYHIAASTNFNKQVTDHMTKAIDAFFSIGGKDTDTKTAVKGGVKELISTALDGFIGSTEAGESEEQVYVVVPENNALVRVDLACWKYHFEQHKFLDQKTLQWLIYCANL